jgi:hypothetical protein
LGACADLYVNVATNQAGVSFAGAVTNTVWTISTAGTAAEVGTIAGNAYTAPTNSDLLEVLLEATVNGVAYTHLVELIDEIDSFQNPDEFKTGDVIEAYFTASPIPIGQKPRIGVNGLLDRLAHPNAMAVGETEDGFKIKEDNNYKKIDGSKGTILITRSKPSVEVEFTMMGHRNPDRLKKAFPHLNVKNVNGATQISSGTGFCACPGSFVIVMANGSCGKSYDVLVVHRYVSMSDFEMDLNPEKAIMHKVKITGLIDTRRPKDEQVWSLYQVKPCATDDECA